MNDSLKNIQHGNQNVDIVKLLLKAGLFNCHRNQQKRLRKNVWDLWIIATIKIIIQYMYWVQSIKTPRPVTF